MYSLWLMVCVAALVAGEMVTSTVRPKGEVEESNWVKRVDGPSVYGGGVRKDGYVPQYNPFNVPRRRDEPDADGYVHWMNEGLQTRNCKEYTVSETPGRVFRTPSDTEFYGPHLTNIQHLRVTPTYGSDGLVKVWLGGVGHHYALVHFKAAYRDSGFSFRVQICW